MKKKIGKEKITMIEYNTLTVEEYVSILNSVEWKIPSLRLLKKSIENGQNVKLIIEDKTVGMASFVTNGGYAGLIIDVIVMPEYQGKGYGKLLINSLLDKIKEGLEEGEEMMIQLLSAPGKQHFYNSFGFKVKKEVVADGMYMWLKK